jgi:zinc transport system permease protein
MSMTFPARRFPPIPKGRAGMDDFVIRALAAGIGVAAVAGPLGCFVVWRRMSYFGTTLAHSALLGVALGFLLEIEPTIGIVVVCVAVALLLSGLEHNRLFASDTLLGILAHGTLAVGLIAMATLPTVRVDLTAYLFGDILAVSRGDLIWIWAGGAACLAALAALWRPLLALTAHEELARVEGVAVERTRLVFMLLIAFVIAVAMKIVGVLLIVSLLIIPAAAARRFAATPETMAALAALVGCVSVAGGLAASSRWDAPAGPAIAAVATALFFLTLIPAGRRA